MKTKGEKKRAVTAQVTPDLWARLDRIARRKVWSMATVARDALNEYAMKEGR